MGASFILILGALTTLVVQTARLVQVAEQYMIELRANNRAVAATAAVVTDALVSAVTTEKAPTDAPTGPSQLNGGA